MKPNEWFRHLVGIVVFVVVAGATDLLTILLRLKNEWANGCVYRSKGFNFK